MYGHEITVLKFGGSVLRTPGDLPRVVHEVYRWIRNGSKVVAVVSAFANVTNTLCETAKSFSALPHEEAFAALVATGEAVSAAQLALALDRAGIPVTLLDPERLGLRSSGPITDATLVDFDEQRIHELLGTHSVAVVPGFVARTADGRMSLLGRGGSDLTAIFLAHRCKAQRCRLIKDVDGWYERDPNYGAGSLVRRYRTISWDEALRLSGDIVQSKAVAYAAAKCVEFEVAALGAAEASVVGPSKTSYRGAAIEAKRRLRVGLLGLGTVGFGVFQSLIEHSPNFELVGIAVRSLERERHPSVPRGLLTTDPREVLARTPDILIELIGGHSPACELIATALNRGIHVVTANKALLASEGIRFAAIAAGSGACLYGSGAVGGAVPMLEAVSQVSAQVPIRKIEAVLNGTSNFVLDQLAAGVVLADAVRAAQERGFAEADPTLDLDGTDAAQKLLLLARAAFGSAVKCTIKQRGIEHLTPDYVQSVCRSGKRIRLVAKLCLNSVAELPLNSAELLPSDNIVAGEVSPHILSATDPLCNVTREENCLIVETQRGERLALSGKGAGRWPTTEAVFADVLDLARARLAAGADEVPQRQFGILACASEFHHASYSRMLLANGQRPMADGFQPTTDDRRPTTDWRLA